jgi:hypothetical protein
MLAFAHRAAGADRSGPDAAHHCDRWWSPADHRGEALTDGLGLRAAAQAPGKGLAEQEPALA